MNIQIKDIREIPIEQVLELYNSNEWSAANKPDELYKGLQNSHSLISAWDGGKLVGIGNAISDGYLVVYYPHLLIRPKYQGKGIGKMIMAEMHKRYGEFHMQMLTADGKAIKFYEQVGFERAGRTEPMWIYKGTEH